MRVQKAMIISVGTGQTGKDIAHGICFSIQHHNPDFLVFLNTKKSQETTMPYIVEDCELRGRKWGQINIDDADDVEKISFQCREAIRSLHSSAMTTRHGRIWARSVGICSITKGLERSLSVSKEKCPFTLHLPPLTSVVLGAKSR